MAHTSKVPGTIDEYIARASPEARPLLKEMRRIVRTAAPEAEELVSYGMPALRQHGILICFGAFKRHMGVFPPVSGDAKLEHALESFAGPKGNLRFPMDQPVPYDLIARIVKLRLRKNLAAAREKSTKRPWHGRKYAVTAKPDSATHTPEAVLQSYIHRLDLSGQKLFRALRAAVRKRLPTANELAYDYSSHFAVAYSPTDRGIDSLVSIGARASGVQLYFTQGRHLPDPTRVLSGSGTLTRFVRVEAARQLAQPQMKALFAAAIDQARVPLPSRRKGGLIIRPTAARGRRR